jgi:endonuclease YncB( thermonuclease family)
MTAIDRDRDVYGRLLRNVQVDGADVGGAMVGAGVARE